MLQKLINYGVDDKCLPLRINAVKIPKSDWELGKKVVDTLIPNQSRFMVSSSWLKSQKPDKDGEEEEQIPVLTGQVLPLWVMDNRSASRRDRTWIGEETMVRVHGGQDQLKMVCQFPPPCRNGHLSHPVYMNESS